MLDVSTGGTMDEITRRYTKAVYYCTINPSELEVTGS